MIAILPLEIQHSPESCYDLDPKISGRSVNSMKERVEKAICEMKIRLANKLVMLHLCVYVCLTNDWSRATMEL